MITAVKAKDITLVAMARNIFTLIVSLVPVKSSVIF